MESSDIIKGKEGKILEGKLMGSFCEGANEVELDRFQGFQW